MKINVIASGRNGMTVCVVKNRVTISRERRVTAKERRAAKDPKAKTMVENITIDFDYIAPPKVSIDRTLCDE